MKIEVIIEKGDGELWGRIEGKADYLPVTVAENTHSVLDNLKMLIKDHLKHEGKNDKFWKKVDPEKIEWDLRYDLQSFFKEHDYLNVSAIAKRAGLNASLVRQYATGIKYPSQEQAKKIEDAVHQLAKELQKVSLIA